MAKSEDATGSYEPCPCVHYDGPGLRDTDECACGHVLDEHEWAGHHPANCVAEVRRG